MEAAGVGLTDTPTPRGAGACPALPIVDGNPLLAGVMLETTPARLSAHLPHR